MKLIYFFSFLIFCNLFFPQNIHACDLIVTDTVHIDCYGNDNGVVYLSGVNGLSPYYYSIDGVDFGVVSYFDSLYAGDYLFFVEDSDNCRDSIHVKIKEPSEIVLDFVCDSVNNLNSLVSGGVKPYYFEWRDSTQSIFSNDRNTVFYGDFKYYLYVLDSNFCSVIDSVYLKADYNLISSLGVCPFEVDAINTSKGYSSSVWFTDNNNFFDVNFNYEYNFVGDYDLTLSVYNNYGCLDTVTKHVVVEGLLPQEEVANVFSPNNDGINDYFNFSENHALVEFCAIIFNRFGEKIFESNDSEMNWDGKDLNGKLLEEGVYFYVLEGTGLTGREYKRKGFLTLFR